MQQAYIQPVQTPATHTRLNRYLLFPVRVLWLLIIVMALCLFTAGLIKRYESLSGVSYSSDIHVNVLQNQKGEIILATADWYGPASQAGLLERDILLAVNDVPVTSVHQAKNLLVGELGALIKLTVRTGNFPARQIAVIQGGGEGLFLRRLGVTRRFAIDYVMASEILFAIICAAIGLIIFWRRSDDWMALLASLTFILLLLGISFPVKSLWDSLAGTRYGPLFELWLWSSIGLLPVLFYLFPSGKFVPRLTMVLTAIMVLWTILQIFYPALSPFHMTQRNAMLTFFSILGTGGLALIYRYRFQSDAMQRRQIRWIVWGALAAVGGLVLQILFVGMNLFETPQLFTDFVIYPFGQLLKLLLPVSVVFAIRRYRLWDINVLINRALVYSALTTLVIGIYVLAVGVLGETMQSNGNWLVSILATGLVAVLVQPLRDRLQRAVNRMMYGERDDPITVLSRLGQRLEGTLAPDAVLPSLIETVAQTLKLPYVAIETVTDKHLESESTVDPSPIHASSSTISYGSPQSDVIRLPLIYQSETIGQLVVAPRAPGEALSPMDRHLLENIAHQAGMAVHAVSLTADLQRSRQHLVTTREEERRRLRRDLHDGLGPNLASQGLKLAAVKQLLENDPSSAIPLLDQVMAQNKSTVEEVRRLVYGLRPPALDELGLVAAIRDHVSGMDGKSTLQIEITEPPEGLPVLSAAVEVAAYRIVLEALTNVIRHAQAKHCSIRFSFNQNGSNDNLQIEIVDDGIGLPHDLRAGVGLRSMRERAEELNGRLTVESQPGVTHVLANLPIGETGMQANFMTQTQSVDSKPMAESAR
jgi:signal transduction histidine kinase